MWVNSKYSTQKYWVDDKLDLDDFIKQNKPITKEKAIGIIKELVNNYLKQAAIREKISEKQVKKKYRSLLYSSLEKEYECGFAYGLITANAILSYLEIDKKENNNE